MPLAVGWSLPEAGLRGCLRQRQSPLAHASPAEGCGALPHGCTPRVLPSKLHSRGPTLASARPRNTSSTPQAASKQRVQVVSNRGSQPEPGGSEAAELDARIFALLIPAMLAVFLDPAMAVVDAAIVGSLGTLQLGAAGLSNLVFFFCTVLFSFLLAVTTPRVAAATAENRGGEASAEIGRALWVAFISGLCVAVVLWNAAPWLFHSVFRLEPAQARLAIPHLQLRSLGSPAAIMLFVLNGAYRGLTDTRTPLLAGAMQNVVNLALDIGLVLGLGWGVSGAAGAAAAGQWVGAAAMAGLLIFRGVLQQADLRTLPTPGQFGGMLREGAPLVCCVGAVISAVFAATNLATGLGPTSLAAHTVVKQITDFCMGILGSFSTAAQSLVASALGQDNKEEARAIVMRLLQIGVQVGTVLMIALVVGRGWLPHLFSGDPAVHSIAQSTLLLIAGAMVLAPCALTLEGTLLGAQAFTWVGARTIAGAAGCGGVLWAAHHYSWGLSGVWLGLLALVGLNGLGDAIRVLLPGSPLDAAPSLVRIVNFKGEESHNASLQRRPGT